MSFFQLENLLIRLHPSRSFVTADVVNVLTPRRTSLPSSGDTKQKVDDIDTVSSLCRGKSGSLNHDFCLRFVAHTILYHDIDSH